ncbi:hypothetical protein TIFTF001_031949 [Ficus carica]|uniref:Uncharacterized protein n=1 Tax=Ficus carica TaxID=3494 RepID=A0AA88J747_FICCA|nr:hypothetical protein TIFTF001_031949 [Ficus carica]
MRMLSYLLRGWRESCGVKPSTKLSALDGHWNSTAGTSEKSWVPWMKGLSDKVDRRFGGTATSGSRSLYPARDSSGRVLHRVDRGW